MGWADAEERRTVAGWTNLGRNTKYPTDRIQVSRRARDGFRARPGGPWTEEKLSYLQRYASAFMTAMAPKRRAGLWTELMYLDFLCGPGIGINTATGREFLGSPLRALNIHPPFDRLVFADVDAGNIRALERRIAAHAQHRIATHVGDCHAVARTVVAQMPQRALGLAFVDPEGVEVTFDLFRVLATRRIDVLYLFPGGQRRLF